VADDRRHADGEARRLIVFPHHPDALRRPPSTSARVSAGEALTWNVFRALQLLPPAFWLRRMNASLGLLPPRPAPLTADVRLWCRLQIPPGTVTSQGPVSVDVRIETEHALWALLVCHGQDVVPAASDGVTDPVTMLAYAASWHAGRRQCYVGVVADDAASAPLAAALVRRYQSLPDGLQRRMPRHAYDSSNVAGVGLTTWPQLQAILRDACESAVIDPVERAIAARAAGWCDRALR
jgi:hypothetical protein